MKDQQITKKQITNAFKHVIKAGYCEFQKELAGLDRNWYTAGTYGWNADIYVLDRDTVLVTGYRPFGERMDHDKVVQLIKEAY